MVNSLHNIKLLSLILALFLIYSINVSSISFGVSPSKIEIRGIVGRETCKKFSLIGEEDILFVGKIKWKKEGGSDEIMDYNLSSDEVRMNITFPEKTTPGKYQICVMGLESGNYSGALFYNINKTNYGLVIRVEVHLENERGFDEIKKDILFLPTTGFFIKGHTNRFIEKIYLIQLIFILISLLSLLVILNKFRRKGN
ncbi:MAG: hypothetical protein QXU40_01075 [Candidatus Pacearchaeota archaeon]